MRPKLVLTLALVCWAAGAYEAEGDDVELAVPVQYRVHGLPPAIGLEGCMLAAALVAHRLPIQVLVEQHLHTCTHSHLCFMLQLQ